MVFDKVKELIVEQFSVTEDSVTMETKLEDLGADSLDVVELIMAVEEEFEVTVDDADVENISTVGDVVNYITAAQ